MRKIYISDVVPGMVLGKKILSPAGLVLLTEDIVIDDKYLERLKKLGISSIFIKDGLTDDIPIPDIIDDQTRIQTQNGIKDIFTAFEKGRHFNLSGISSFVNTIMDELLSSSQIVYDLTDIKSFDEYTFQHSVNVCILALITGITLNYNQLQLRDLGIGALLHDMGRIKVSKHIFDKPEKLNSDELSNVKKHCTLGFEILRNYDNVNIISAHVAFQHHENFDGTGYPRGLAGKSIHEYARIVAYCDVYDALTSDRPYRKAFRPKEALKIIKDLVGTQLDPQFANPFFKNVVIFPVGSIIQLNSGEVGVIIKNNKEFLNQPVVRIILDRKHQRLKKPLEINLAEKKGYNITKLLNESDPLIPSITQIQARIQSTD